jgi:hypothetical protein
MAEADDNSIPQPISLAKALDQVARVYGAKMGEAVLLRWLIDEAIRSRGEWMGHGVARIEGSVWRRESRAIILSVSWREGWLTRQTFERSVARFGETLPRRHSDRRTILGIEVSGADLRRKLGGDEAPRGKGGRPESWAWEDLAPKLETERPTFLDMAAFEDWCKHNVKWVGDRRKKKDYPGEGATKAAIERYGLARILGLFKKT